jgi:hypothetical protein
MDGDSELITANVLISSHWGHTRTHTRMPYDTIDIVVSYIAYLAI